MNTDNTNGPKVALIFGGSRGIGAAIVRRLSRDGFAVGFTYVSRSDSAKQLAEGLTAEGGHVLPVEADSADACAIQQAVERVVSHFHRLDVVVVNAGILRLGTVDALSLEDLDEVLRVNVRGVYIAIQACIRRMSNGGRIVTIGSNTAVRPLSAAGTVYGMSKAAVAAMAKGLAFELAPRGIRVNNIQPGPVRTDMTAEHLERIKEMIPLGQAGEPEDIAELVSYLASGFSSYMTGANLTIDGGMSI